jgi:HEAT repeat protein
VRTRLLLLGGQSVGLGLVTVLLVAPVSALFLAEYGAGALAYAYLAVAATGVLVSAAMSRAQRRISLAALVAAVFWTFLVVVAAGWLVLMVWGRLWVTFPMLVLYPLIIPIGFALLGAQAGRLLDVRQMKAYFPRVAAGFSVGFALGGVAAALLVQPLGGPKRLIGVDLLAGLLMLGLVVATSRRYPAELAAAPEPAHVERAGSDRRTLMRNRLVVVIFGYQVLSAAVTFLLDYMVWERAAARYPDPSDLATFQGVFGAILNVSSVVFTFAFAGWILTRFGIGVGLAANPVAVLVLLCVTSVAGVAVGIAAFAFFALVCLQQITDIALTDGTTRTSINATYQALLPRLRLQAQTMTEAAGIPIALGLVGVLIIGQHALDLDVRAIALVTLVLTAVWSVAAVVAYREYGANLRDVLSRRAWDPVAIRVDDERSRSVVESLLHDGDLRDSETALEAMADSGSPALPDQLTALMASTDPERRSLAATVAGTAGLLEQQSVAASVERLVRDPDPSVRLSAAAVLAEHDPTARAAWVAALDAGDETRLLALEAAARTPAPSFVPHLVDLASRASAPEQLLDALVAHAEWVAPLLSASGLPPLARQRIVYALGEAGTPTCRAALVARLNDGEPGVAEAAARALAVAGHGETPSAAELHDALASQAVRAHRSLQLIGMLDGTPHTEPLRDALRDEVATAGRRVEVLLGLAYDPRVVGAGTTGLASDNERDRNTAVEMLEVTLGRSLARMLLAVWSAELDDGMRKRMLGEYAAVDGEPTGDWLRTLVLDEAGYWREPWLRACALYASPTVAPGEARVLASKLVDDTDPVVAETARWVVSEGWSGPSSGE